VSAGKYLPATARTASSIKIALALKGFKGLSALPTRPNFVVGVRDLKGFKYVGNLITTEC
jgi:hypothetical protein